MNTTDQSAGPALPSDRRGLLLARANLLAILTIGYNLMEGGVSVALGSADETLALFGFGVDSFIEVISAVGVWHMLRRIRANQGETRDAFEQRALRITGGAFYALTLGLVLMAGLNLIQQHGPETTFWGVVVSLVSMSFMWLLIHYKTRVGTALNSPAILADAACSRACVYLSVVLLIASVGFELTGIGSLDAIGALLIAWFSWKEGREAFGKARGLDCACSCGGG
jgi:divalent metal cation (Fe/Co/Zn/Cd) transporter